MRRLLLALTFAASSLIFAAPEAEACLNGVIMEQSEVVQNLRIAEKALEKGKNKKVLRLLNADHFMVDGALMKRVRIVKAVAKLRLGKTKGPERLFRNLLKKDKENPYLKARLAEALHKRRGDDAVEAWKIMDDLEERDLIPDAHGYAVLAKLRQRSNDVKGHERAIAACRVMAGDESPVCSV
jgi:hypothetical protein